MTVIERFSDTTGLVRAEHYSRISLYPDPDLVRLLKELPQHEGSLAELAIVPCHAGERFLLIRPANARSPVWLCACPMVTGGG